MARQEQLEIISPSGEVKFLNLDPSKGIVNIGRHPENDLVLEHPQVGLFHAVLDFRQKPYRIMSLGTDGDLVVGNERLPANGKISIRVAAPVEIAADGNVFQRRTQRTTIADVLDENGIHLKSQDQVFLDGRLVEADAALPRYTASVGRQAMPASTIFPTRLTVERAMPLTVNDNGLVSTLYTTDTTLGSALTHAGVLVYLGDSVTPDLANPMSAGASVFIRRSRPASITVDGRVIKTRTRATNVAGLLAQAGVMLDGKDYTAPTPTSLVLDNMNVNVTRVREVFITETEQIPFETKWVPDPDLEIDQRTDAQLGAKGVKNRLFKSVYENGKLISHGLEREWIANPPQNHLIHYGTKIVLHDLTLPDGSVVQYWRKISLLATSYTAATSGKPKTHPEYGITYLGLKAARGIVAVDPRVINLRDGWLADD